MFLFVCFIVSNLLAGPIDWKTPQNTDKKLTSTVPDIAKKEEKIEEYAIIHTENGFLPQKLYLKAKQNVKIYVTGTTGKNTSFIIDDLNIFKGVSKDSVTEVSFVPVKEGAYAFYCPITNKKGWIIVKGQ
jgi:plastocyanin domain-containing protein